MRDIKIGKDTIGFNQPLYFVADIAANHDGDLERAYKLIELAKEAGAHATKFQNFVASKIVSRSGFDKLSGQLSHQAKWKKSVYETYADASVSYDWTKKLKEKCDEVGITYFTSPYDFHSVDHVDPFVPAYKIGSGDVTWHEIIEHIAGKGKPVLMATGASTMDEVQLAMDVLQKHTHEIVLMQCNTNYTASLENFKYLNLNVLKEYARKYPNTILGLSDHTPGHASVLGAVTLGARVIEKHFTDDTTREGPDHKFSMDFNTWKDMVSRTRELENSLGLEIKKVEENEAETVVLQRRSIRAKKDLTAGDMVRVDDLEFLRPCPEDALPPYKLEKILDKELVENIKSGDYIKWTSIK